MKDLDGASLSRHAFPSIDGLMFLVTDSALTDLAHAVQNCISSPTVRSHSVSRKFTLDTGLSVLDSIASNCDCALNPQQAVWQRLCFQEWGDDCWSVPSSDGTGPMDLAAAIRQAAAAAAAQASARVAAARAILYYTLWDRGVRPLPPCPPPALSAGARGRAGCPADFLADSERQKERRIGRVGGGGKREGGRERETATSRGSWVQGPIMRLDGGGGDDEVEPGGGGGGGSGGPAARPMSLGQRVIARVRAEGGQVCVKIRSLSLSRTPSLSFSLSFRSLSLSVNVCMYA